MRFTENIIRLERHLKNIGELKYKDIKDYLVFTTLSMECFQVVNSLIEIGEYIVSKEKIGFPSSYREIFELLFRVNFISEDELKIFRRLVYLRNLISYEYYRISEKELLEMIDLFEKVNNFIEKIKEWGRKYIV